MKTSKKGYSSSCKGSVLLISLFIVAAMLILGMSAIFTSNIDLKIAGNTKTATRSLYVADSGMHMVKKDLLDKAAQQFTATTSSINTTQHTVLTTGDANGKTLRNQANWGLTGTFPITKTYNVDGQTASVVVPAPVWEASKDAAGNWVMGKEPGTSIYDDPNYFSLNFRDITSSSADGSAKIAGNLRVEFRNNLLFFQNNPLEASPVVDLGISASDGDIEGVATNFDSDKILIVNKLDLTTTRWQIFGEPCRNTTTFIFRLGTTLSATCPNLGKVYYFPANTPSPNNWFPGSSTVTSEAGEPTIATIIADVGTYTNKRLPVVDLASGKIDLVSGATIISRGLSEGDQFRIEVKMRASLIPTQQLLRLEELNGVTFSTLGAACVSAIGVDCSTLASRKWNSFN